MIKGWDKLTDEEKHHVRAEAVCHTEREWQENVVYQKGILEKGYQPRCQRCVTIMVKLGQINMEDYHATE